MLIVFDHTLALRSYIETNQLNDLKSVENSISFVPFEQDRVRLSSTIPIEVLELRRITKFLLSLNARLYWLARSSRSYSFRRSVWRHDKFRIPAFIENFFLQPLTRPLCIIFVCSVFFTQANFYKRLTHFVENGGKEILYVSVGGSTSMNDFLCLFARRFNIKLSVMLENWDNISSKAVFNFIPSRIGVWGKQAQKFSELIHNIPVERTELIGNPRVEWLKRNINTKEIGSHIFFAGGSENFDEEIEYLVTVAKLVQKSVRPTEVRYLPHPKRYLLAREKITLLECMGVRILNKEMISKQASPGSNFQLPRIDLYRLCFEGAALVISPLSTMNLEAGILGIPTIGVNVLDINVRGWRKPYVSRVHDHLKDLEDKGMMHLVRSPQELASVLSQVHDGNFDFKHHCMKETDINYLYSYRVD